jgi:hypothetical protein
MRIFSLEGPRSRRAAAALCVMLCACVPAEPRPEWKLEVVSPREQALADILAAPTQFVIRPEDNNAAWERAASFFRLYLKEGGAPPFSLGEDSITNAVGPGVKYVYEVERAPMALGFEYSVTCRPSGPVSRPELARRNAQNLARFIKDGTLELLFLER